MNIRVKTMNLAPMVVGREKDLEALKIQFDALLEGRRSLAVIAGDTGIGKTTLVKKALADLSQVNGTCVYGKFEQYDGDKPYMTIIQILEQITGHLLTLSEDKLNKVRTELVQKLGKDRALLSGMVPRSRGIMGLPNNIRVHDYQQLKHRLEKAVRTFVAIAARELYPLVIAVDDLQWADTPSWDMLKAIYGSCDDHPFFLILVYKNDREEYRAKGSAMLAELAGGEPVRVIHPEPLLPRDVEVMLSRSFAGRFENFREFVRLVYRKTAGNPLFIEQVLKLFLENKSVDYDPETKVWRLDWAKADLVHLPDRLVDLIGHKIDYIPTPRSCWKLPPVPAAAFPPFCSAA